MASIQSVSIHDRAHVHLGDVYNAREPDGIPALGLCLGLAPTIDADNFIGRADELQQMERILQPGKPVYEQRRLVLGGMGGIGKTQLAISYARQHQPSYTSVFWLNATTELTLKASFRSLAQNIVKARYLETLTDEQTFRIEKYCPNIGHGSFLITSRLPERVKGQQVRVQPLRDVDECLRILRTRSQREIDSEDPAVHHLIDRLGGLPLALATAGAYLSRGSISIGEYLRAYEQRWRVDPRRPPRLRDYENRTLYTTWNLTYSQLEVDDHDAAQLLRLLGYLQNQQISFDLLQAGIEDSLPAWLQQLLTDAFSFASAMSILIEYCLVEREEGSHSYGVHSCVHDWILHELNPNLDSKLYWYVLRSLYTSIDSNDWDNLGHVRYNRIALHAKRLTHERFQQWNPFDGVKGDQVDQAVWLAELMARHTPLASAATWMYEQALTQRKRISGVNHALTLAIVANLGLLYRIQDRFDEAEALHKMAVAGYEDLVGPDHILTLTSIDNLGILYNERGHTLQAQELLERALAGRERTLGCDHLLTLHSYNNVGLLCLRQEKLDEAESMLNRVLVNGGHSPSHDPRLIPATYNNLGWLYKKQGRYVEAEKMFTQALKEHEKFLGRNHDLTLDTVNNLGVLYTAQGKLNEAEHMHLRALSGTEKVLGHNHTLTLSTVDSLGTLYTQQGRLKEAEQMYLRAVAGREKVLGASHTSTLDSKQNLGLLYIAQDRLDLAEGAFLQVFFGRRKTLGTDHTSSLDLIDHLGRLYIGQNKLTEAEHIYSLILPLCHYPETNSAWAHIIIRLTGVLCCRVMRAQTKEDKESQFVHLVRHVTQWQRINTPRTMRNLSRALINMKDDTNAQVAELHRCRLLLATSWYNWIICDGCETQVTLNTGCYLCRQCWDVDLCDACISKYPNTANFIPGCYGHEFFDAGSALSQSLRAPQSDETNDVGFWLANLEQQYLTKQGDDSNFDRASASGDMAALMP